MTPQMKMDLRKELQQAINKRNVLTGRSKMKIIKMLDVSSVSDLSLCNDYDRRDQLRRKSIEEILTSEQAYIKQLDKLMDYFVVPIKEKMLIDFNSHQCLFGQLELIYNLNKELLERLENDLDDCANAFLKLAPFFKIYSVYAFDFKQSLILLQNLTTKNSAFKAFLVKTESRPEVQQKLSSLLITPIQRVPRYRLLLQQVLLYTSPADIDYKLIQDSVKQIENTVSHINSVVEDQENLTMMLNIQNSLTNRIPHIVKPSRKVVKEGVLFKYSANGTLLKRYCVLCSDIFMYCKILKERKITADGAVENSLDCCCIFPLKKCKVQEIFAGKFKITCQGDGIIMCSEDVKTGRSWIQSIKETIDEHVEGRKTIRKDSSKRLPMRKKEAKKFESREALSPGDKKYNFDKVFYGQNMSDLELKGDKIGCFQTASRKLTKRKHSEMNSSDVTATATEAKRSFFSTIGEKFGFHRTSETVAKPILVAQDNQQVSSVSRINVKVHYVDHHRIAIHHNIVYHNQFK
ncbi:unnamed protein product [Diamesa serratosioi]